MLLYILFLDLEVFCDLGYLLVCGFDEHHRGLILIVSPLIEGLSNPEFVEELHHFVSVLHFLLLSVIILSMVSNLIEGPLGEDFPHRLGNEFGRPPSVPGILPPAVKHISVLAGEVIILIFVNQPSYCVLLHAPELLDVLF